MDLKVIPWKLLQKQAERESVDIEVYVESLNAHVGNQRREIERLQTREIKVSVALRAVLETVQKDSPQWLLANELLKILGGPCLPVSAGEKQT
jgi:hypothetical protein